MHGYKPTYIKNSQHTIVGTVVDYQSSDDGEKTILFIDTEDGEKVSLDPFDRALSQCLQYLNLEAPSDLIGGLWRFGKRDGPNGKAYFDIKRATQGEESARPAPRSSAPTPAASGEPAASAPSAAPTLTVAEAAKRYDEAIGLLIANTIPKLEMQLQGSLSDQVLAEFLHGAAATVLIATVPKPSGFPPKTGGAKGWYAGKPAWKR